MNNQNPFVSIIMPVYNCEKVISIAIESIRQQTLSKWELIIVDDCSTDKTRYVVQRYEKIDSRIRLITQKVNTGPGHAKNIGIDAAKGVYVTFADADDWLEPDTFEKMTVNMCVHEDVIIAGYYRDICNADGKILEQKLVCSEAFRCNTREDAIACIPQMDAKRLFSFAWNKLYRKEVLDTHNIVSR